MKIFIAELDKPNKNGRIYPREVIYNQIEQLKGKPVFGQLGMCEGTGEIPLDKISHSVSDLSIENINGVDYFVGELKILDTPSGEILKDLNSMCGSIANNFRCAGIGTIKRVEEGDDVIVQDDYRLLSINYTDDPA